MTPASNLDWLYHTLGWALGAAGLLLSLWALFWDRSRGRRRCPKCWYDMAGVPGLKCPECGVTCAREARLHRSRRRWKFAVAGALPMLAPCALILNDMWNRGRLQLYLPNRILIECVDVNSNGWIEHQTVAERELFRRIGRDSLGEHSWQILHDRLFRASPNSRAALVNCRSRWSADRELVVCIHPPQVGMLQNGVGTDRVRVRLDRTKDGTSGEWVEKSGSLLIGPIAIGYAPHNGPVELDVQLCRGSKRLWSGRIALAVTVDPGATPRPVSDSELDAKVIGWMNPHLQVFADHGAFLWVQEAGRQAGVGRDLALGAKFTIVRQGRIRGVSEKSWGPELVSWCGTAPTGSALRIAWKGEKPTSSELCADDWELQIEGNADLALLDFDQWGWTKDATPIIAPWSESDEYWSGSACIPLRVQR